MKSRPASVRQKVCGSVLLVICTLQSRAFGAGRVGRVSIKNTSQEHCIEVGSGRIIREAGVCLKRQFGRWCGVKGCRGQGPIMILLAMVLAAGFLCRCG